MFNKKFMLILVGIAGLAVKASPVTDENFAIISTQETEFGTVTVWGEPDSAPTKRDELVAPLEKRECGTPQIICSGNNVANAISCTALINLLGASSGIVLPTSPRSICLTQSGTQCCVSWSKVVNGLLQGNLISMASSTFNACNNGSGRLSGRVTNVDLQGVCLTQCLSNRPTGCA